MVVHFWGVRAKSCGCGGSHYFAHVRGGATNGTLNKMFDFLTHTLFTHTSIFPVPNNNNRFVLG